MREEAARKSIDIIRGVCMAFEQSGNTDFYITYIRLEDSDFPYQGVVVVYVSTEKGDMYIKLRLDMNIVNVAKDPVAYVARETLPLIDRLKNIYSEER